ncbi:MAG: hypothetical protein ABSD47_11295 [Candidatus Methylomirabilota bacterium]|jgi:hypothetical protein
MAMTAADIEKQALSWLRQNREQRSCQHHWAEASGLTSPEHEQALGSLLRTIQASKKFPGFVVEDGVCARCEATGDKSVKRVIRSLKE